MIRIAAGNISLISRSVHSGTGGIQVSIAGEHAANAKEAGKNATDW